MTRLTISLVALLFISAGCSSRPQLTMPLVRCYHVGQNVRVEGQEDVFLSIVSEGPKGATATQRFPQDPNNEFLVRGGSVDGRKWVDVSGARQMAPVLWQGELGSGDSVHLFVHFAKKTPGTASPLPKLLSSLSEAVDQDEQWSANDKATLRHLGLAAKEDATFAPAGTTTIGAFVISVNKRGPLAEPTLQIHSIDSARDSKSGFIGGATVECFGDRSKYEIGVSLGK